MLKKYKLSSSENSDLLATFNDQQTQVNLWAKQESEGFLYILGQYDKSQNIDTLKKIYYTIKDKPVARRSINIVYVMFNDNDAKITNKISKSTFEKYLNELSFNQAHVAWDVHVAPEIWDLRNYKIPIDTSFQEFINQYNLLINTVISPKILAKLLMESHYLTDVDTTKNDNKYWNSVKDKIDKAHQQFRDNIVTYKDRTTSLLKYDKQLKELQTTIKPLRDNTEFAMLLSFLYGKEKLTVFITPKNLKVGLDINPLGLTVYDNIIMTLSIMEGYYSILVHELGHASGLSHTYDYPYELPTTSTIHNFMDYASDTYLLNSFSFYQWKVIQENFRLQK